MFRRSDSSSDDRSDSKIEKGLSRTRQGFFGRIAGLLGASDVDDDFWDELEALLIQSDVGVNTTLELIEGLRQDVDRRSIRRASDVKQLLQEQMVAILEEPQRQHAAGPRLLTIILVVGVNGSGKTTSIAKLAHYHQDRGHKVVLAAADTFRAAAIDQLKIWGQRAGVDVISHQPGADPGAVVYDAIKACQSRGADVLIVDTAGRLHTRYNLMEELKKMRRVAARQVHRAPHETLLVLDATTGQNGLVQARVFKEVVEITGLILAKLDGTARGGIAFAVCRDLQLPIQFVGTGEQMDDFAEFDARTFVNGLFAENIRP